MFEDIRALYPERAALSIEQFRKTIGASRAWVEYQIERGNLHRHKVGGKVLIPMSEIERFVSQDNT